MSLGHKLYELRKKKGLSQEEIGYELNVTRQTISKWETNQSIPELDKLTSISKLFEISIDELLNNKKYIKNSNNDKSRYEYKSKKTLFGMPLVHINIGKGKYTAKGIIAIGNFAFGLFSLGFISIGLISFGVLAIGLIALGILSIAGLSMGAIAFGIFALGAIAFGYFATGAVAIGVYAAGAVAIAKNIAVGYYANAHIAIGEITKGNIEILRINQKLQNIEYKAVVSIINNEFPKILQLIKEIIFIFIK